MTTIKRILDPKEFCQVIDDLYELFKEDDQQEGHQILTHCPESIKVNFGNSSILHWELFVWANKTGDKFDAAIMFLNDKNAKFNKQIFSEFLWLSKNPNVGYKLFSTAIKFARQKKFQILATSTVVANPSHFKLKKFYESIGMKKDSETYICKL